ncbi:SF1B family DNA helicase RecD2 [Piscirickettsia litoralis]|uniref:SF1B family DNA helicase RecD2 n=1 Tax=Piscirickettsia litoralis TaxID=1891921 RepID=UPI000AEF842F|nr:AAA family ATPase [Piscirickettsia litoralis]
MQQTNNDDSSLISGAVERITYHNEENGFCIIRVKAKGHRDFVTVKGKVASIHAGEFIESGGEWINDRNYGMQFQSKWLRVVPPTTLEGIQKYLGSGMIKGIGSHFAKVLVKAFGEDVFTVIEDQPERLHSLPGIGKKRVNIITKAWEEQKVVRSIMLFLQSNGVGTARAVRIYKTYGEEAIAIVSDNPYRLALDIRGIGFKTADELALRLGIPQDSIKRAQAGVRHVLQEICSEGHCAAQEQHLIEKSVELLAVPIDLIRAAIEAELQENRVLREVIDDMPCIYLDKLYHAENSVSQQVARLVQGEQPKWSNIDAEAALQQTQQQVQIQLSPSQHKAVINSLHNKVSIITGGPGVGKTTVVNTIIKIIHSTRAKVTLCAPTGRAAKRLSESTGLEAKTIHRLLEFNPSSYLFKYNREKPLDTDFLVCDEASMIDISLMNSLLKAIPSHAAVLIVGDIDQLPSVGPGAVLSDMIESEMISTAQLTDIFRQAKSSRIIVNAHRINEGKAPFESVKGEKSDFFTIHANDAEGVYNKLIKVVTERIPKVFNLNPIDDIQILTPMNRAGLGGKITQP